MAHFEDALFAGVADKLGREEMKYGIGDKVFVAGYEHVCEGAVYEVVRCSYDYRTQKYTYDLWNREYDNRLYKVPAYKLRLCRTSGRLMVDRARIFSDVIQPMHFVTFNPKKVIFNDPATIVLWDDGTKTVVKCSEGDTYDPEKGFMLCYLKRLMGKNYYKYISKTVKKYKED